MAGIQKSGVRAKIFALRVWKPVDGFGGFDRLARVEDAEADRRYAWIWGERRR